MKVVIFSESSVDETAIRNLIQGLLGGDVDCPTVPWLKTRGWPSVLEVLPKVVQYTYYETDARGLAVVVDSDHTPLHRQVHDQTLICHEKCRMCRLRSAVRETQKHLTSVPERGPLGVAIGLAVPAIEAWYRCGVDHGVNEAAWSRALDSGDYPYDTRRLKQAVYGTDRPTIVTALQAAAEQTRRLVDQNELSRLHQNFPLGFGILAEEVRSWRS